MEKSLCDVLQEEDIEKGLKSSREKKGLKYDGCGGDGNMKLRFDLIPWDIIEDLARIYTYGASKKYSDNSWQNVENGKERYFAAFMRHLIAWKEGAKIDHESGLSHLSHALWNIVALCWLDKQ